MHDTVGVNKTTEMRRMAIQAVIAGLPVGVVAAIYEVNCSTLWRWRQHMRTTGLAAGRSPGRPRCIGAAQTPLLEAQLRLHPDATLAEHVELWSKRVGAKVSRATMDRAIKALGWTRKKRVCALRNKMKRRAQPGGKKPASGRQICWFLWTNVESIWR